MRKVIEKVTEVGFTLYNVNSLIRGINQVVYIRFRNKKKDIMGISET